MTWKKPHYRQRSPSFKVRSSSPRTKIEDIARNEFRRMPAKNANGFVFADGLAIIPHPKEWPMQDSSMKHAEMSRWMLAQVGIPVPDHMFGVDVIKIFMSESRAIRVTIGTDNNAVFVEAIPPITPQQIEYIRKASKSTDDDLIVWEVHGSNGTVNGEGRYLEFMHAFHQNNWGDQL